MLPVVLALIASTMLGVGVAMQHEAAAEQTDVAAMDPRLLVRLIGQKKWLIGMGLGTSGALIQASAIATGLLVVVAPIAALHVAVALGFASFRSGRRLERRHWRALIAAVLGLAGFLIAAAPSAAEDAGPKAPWLLLIAGVLALVVVARSMAGRLAAPRAALLLAAVAGVGFGHADGTIKLITDAADADGWGAAVSLWAFPVWFLLSGTCFWLQQSAHNIADITASLPATSVIQPAVGALLGTLMFGERLRGGFAIPFEVGFVALAIAGVIVLASTPLPAASSVDA